MSVTLFSFLGIIVGAILQYFFTRHHDNQNYMRELRTNSYKDYLKLISNNIITQPDDFKIMDAQLIDAKGRICLYGSHEVIHSLANFERAGGFKKIEKNHDLYVKMITKMRKDAEGIGFARFEDVKAILNDN